MLSECKFTKKDLLKLPRKDWSEVKIYNSLLVCKAGRHESGFARMLIVGLRDYNLEKAEIISTCSDDIEWQMNGFSFRNDMHYPSGIIHFWSPEVSFKVGSSLSTIKIGLIEKIEVKNEK